METEEAVLTDSLYCYRDKDRLCGPECTAWVSQAKDDKGPLGFVQKHCILLSSVERTARHAVILAGLLSEMNGRSKVVEQDRKRAEAMKSSGGPFAGPFPLKGSHD